MVDEYKHDLVLIDLKNALMYLQTLADADTKLGRGLSVKEAYKFIDEMSTRWNLNHPYINKE